MPHPDDDPGHHDLPPPRHDSPLGDYGRRTGINLGFFRNTLKGWLEIVEGLVLLVLCLSLAAPIVTSTIVPKGELGFGRLIFIIPIFLLAALLGALPLALLRGVLAEALLLRALITLGMIVMLALTHFRDDLMPPPPASPLHAAVEAGTVLEPGPLPEGAALEARDDRGRTPLAAAVWEAARQQAATPGRIALIRQLIERGANVNARDSDGRTPLLYALNRPELLDLLVAHGANPNLAYPEMSGGEPCHTMWYWISRGPPDRLAAIADRFPELKVPQDRDGRLLAGPLYDVSVLSQQPAMLRYFLARGFDPNAVSRRCTFGRTPLHNVVHWPEPLAREGIDLLLAAGADIDASADGGTPLMIAGKHPGTVKYLIERGANINAMEGGRSVLDRHEKWGHAESARLLREAGALSGEEIRAAREAARAAR